MRIGARVEVGARADVLLSSRCCCCCCCCRVVVVAAAVVGVAVFLVDR